MNKLIKRKKINVYKYVKKCFFDIQFGMTVLIIDIVIEWNFKLLSIHFQIIVWQRDVSSALHLQLARINCNVWEEMGNILSHLLNLKHSTPHLSFPGKKGGNIFHYYPLGIVEISIAFIHHMWMNPTSCLREMEDTANCAAMYYHHLAPSSDGKLWTWADEWHTFATYYFRNFWSFFRVSRWYDGHTFDCAHA